MENITAGQIVDNWKVLRAMSPKSFLCQCLLCKKTTRRLYLSDFGLILSCGCQNKKIRSQIKKGTIFGAWTVLSDNIENQKAFCHCSCGEEATISYRLLATGKSTSCGCKYKVSGDMFVGQVHGYWRVEEILKDHNVIVFCTGCQQTTKTIPAYWLVRPKSKSLSCGCKAIEIHEASIYEIYGVRNGSQSPIIKAKTKKTMIAKFGVEHMAQLPENRNKLINWCENNPEKRSPSSSKPELEILTWIHQFFPNAKKLIKNRSELDIYISELKLGIEHNGLYRHSELFKPNDYHLKKTKHFKNLEIRTIHIWGHEWAYKRNQVKSFLLSAIGKNANKIGARKCKVIWSNSKEEIKKSHRLLNDTHIQGHTNSTKYVANVYYNDELLATATFGKHHRDSKTWVLSRFTTKTNYTIQGILSKISKLASKELQSDIISWADYRLSDGNGYEKAGWKLEELLPSDYFYSKSSVVFSKQSRQKKLVGTPEGMTEHEHALKDGLVRIYDCGKIRYKYEYRE